MQITAVAKLAEDVCAYVVPFTTDLTMNVAFGADVESALKAAISSKFKGNCGEICALTVPTEKGMRDIILVGMGDVTAQTNRKIYLTFVSAFKKCKDLKALNVAVALANVPYLVSNKEICEKIFEAPFYVNYSFDYYKTNGDRYNTMEHIEFQVGDENYTDLVMEATHCGEAAAVCRDLINHPSMYMTPTKLADEAKAKGEAAGMTVTIYNKKQIEELKMGALLSVSKGATEEPRVIVMRYEGAEKSAPTVGIIGKGLTFDSGGYSLKSSMATMHGDMGGAGATVGAMLAIANSKLKANVVAVIPACENKIGPDAYVPGDVLFSMSGKTIEMLNSDAEGRLALVDAITYAIRNEKVDSIIDIATLTGAASGAVGAYTAPVLTNDEQLWNIISKASDVSCEKIWRLNTDDELRPVLNSNVADIKNSNPGNTSGGGTIVAALFIRDFIENKPWVHIDIAPVSFKKEGGNLAQGSTGYGVSLLYHTVKNISNQ